MIILFSEEQDNELLHKLLYALISRPKEELYDNKWCCPIQCFYAGFFLESTGSFKEPTLVTPYLSRMKYCMRSVVFTECWNQKENNGEDFAK